MQLSDIIEAIERFEKELVVFNATDEEIAVELANYFETQNVVVETAETASGRPADVAVLSGRGEVLSIVDVGTFRELLESVPGAEDGVGIDDAAYEDFLAHLKETTFTSYDTRQMVYASREIEDRARRVRRGTLHSTFQEMGNFLEQREVYEDIARRGVEVHAYALPTDPPPDVPEVSVHAIDNEEIATTWVVAFDGGGRNDQKSALIAEERIPGLFYGAWTYDPGIVDRIVSYFEERYVDRTGDGA